MENYVKAPKRLHIPEIAVKFSKMVCSERIWESGSLTTPNVAKGGCDRMSFNSIANLIHFYDVLNRHNLENVVIFYIFFLS